MFPSSHPGQDLHPPHPTTPSPHLSPACPLAHVLPVLTHPHLHLMSPQHSSHLQLWVYLLLRFLHPLEH